MLTDILIFLQTHAIEIIGSIFGIIYFYYEFKADPKLWWASIAMSVFYLYVFIVGDMMAWAATYLYYFFASVYGMIAWKRKAKKGENGEEELKIKNIGLKDGLISAVLMVAISLLLYIVLTKYTETIVPISESISTGLSIVAMWWLTKKYIEHWYIWIVVNILYAYGNFVNDYYFMGIFFTLYIAAAYMGFVYWRKLQKR